MNFSTIKQRMVIKMQMILVTLFSVILLQKSSKWIVEFIGFSDGWKCKQFLAYRGSIFSLYRGFLSLFHIRKVDVIDAKCFCFMILMERKTCLQVKCVSLVSMLIWSFYWDKGKSWKKIQKEISWKYFLARRGTVAEQ